MELPQQNNVDLGGSIMRGYEFGQNARMKNLQMLAAQTELEQRKNLQALYTGALAGDERSKQALAMQAPEAYKGLQQRQEDLAMSYGQIATTIKNTPLPYKNKVIQSLKAKNPNLPISDQWYDGMAEEELAPLINGARKVEDLAKQEFEMPKQLAEIARTKAQTQTEAFQQRNYAANTAKSYADIGKTKMDTYKVGQEVQAAQQELDAARKAGLSPSAFKSQQIEYGKARGEKASDLANLESTLPQLLNTVNKLSDLGQKATYTYAGRAGNFLKRQAGMDVGEGAIAREKYINTVNDQVLPLLRQTFGAAFTAKEGDSLKETLGDPNKSPQEKDAALQAFIEQKINNVKAGQSELGYQQNIPNLATKGKYSVMGGNLIQEGQTATNPRTGQRITFIGGRWQ